MSLAIKENNLAVSELKLPSPSDLCLGQISVKNCKNATIGTKIDGNVIVNQYFNDIPADKAAGNGNGIPFTDSVVLEDWTQKILKYKYIWLSLILAVVITTVICIVYIPQNHPHNDNEDVQLPHNYSRRLRSKAEWFSAITEDECSPLPIQPAKFVLVSHTVTTNCYKEINCENVVKGIQAYDLKKKYCDIAYNFLIGGDGYIYEGRGWGKYGAHTYGFNCDSVGIAFLGNYNVQFLSPKMEDAFHLVIEEGLKLGEIAQDYKLFGQAQVKSTDSPGVHVMEKIKNWKGWSNATREDIMYTAKILNFTEALQTRQQWSKSKTEIGCQLLIEQPTKYVVIGHTVTLPCQNPFACETTLLQIQNHHRAIGRCDISYNFVIGDDGYIYEGRGWTKLGVKSLSFSCSSLGIGLVGNFNLNKPSDIMLQALNLLLEEGVSLGHISSTYKVIAHSQLNNWGSPGIYVEELMKKWDHWSLLSKKDFQCPNTSDI